MKISNRKKVIQRPFFKMNFGVLMSILVVMACSEEGESVSPALTISSFSPESGSEGATVVISGTGFSSTLSENVVSFNGTTAIITEASTTSLTVSVPEGATTGTVSVAVDGETATSSSDFTVESDDEEGTTGSVADCSDATTPTEKVVCAANALIDLLSEDQLSSLIVDYAVENATAWSNLPCGASCRVGILLSDLTDEQQLAALAVVEAATGSTANEGYEEINLIRDADDVLGDAGGMGGGGGGGYSSETYLLAFLGTPSISGTWQLQFGGHHLAHNITYEAGEVVSATPLFEGVEPTSWTGDDGTVYAPLEQEREAMAAMLASLSDSELASAKLSSTFSDVILGPDEDGQFPQTKSGIAVSNLSQEQKALVVAAMSPWVLDVDDQTAASLLETYESELDETYISYSGNSTLENHQDYVRIDGPSVWIEFVCQNGVVFSEIHYHTVWRDHSRDYGANFSF